jgi:hypothetical protein
MNEASLPEIIHIYEQTRTVTSKEKDYHESKKTFIVSPPGELEIKSVHDGRYSRENDFPCPEIEDVIKFLELKGLKDNPFNFKVPPGIPQYSKYTPEQGVFVQYLRTDLKPDDMQKIAEAFREKQTS